MSLADYVVEKATISLKGKPLMEVRGLSLEDVTMLINLHLDDLTRLADMVDTQKENLISRITADGFATKLLLDCPKVAARIIATAADQEDMVDRIRLLPFATSVLALKEISRLTLEDMGGPKELAGLVRQRMTDGTPTEFRQMLQNTTT